MLQIVCNSQNVATNGWETMKIKNKKNWKARKETSVNISPCLVVFCCFVLDLFEQCKYIENLRKNVESTRSEDLEALKAKQQQQDKNKNKNERKEGKTEIVSILGSYWTQSTFDFLYDRPFFLSALLILIPVYCLGREGAFSVIRTSEPNKIERYFSRKNRCGNLEIQKKRNCLNLLVFNLFTTKLME